VADPFDGIEAKIDRAGEHIDALYGEIREWAKGDPYTVEAEPKGQSTHHRLYVRLHEVPDVRRWGLLFGDAVHNLRSALDHLVYAGAIRVSGQDPPPDFNVLQFVIADDEPRWASGLYHLKVPPLSEEMRTFVKSVQPYEASGVDRVQYDFLRWLRDLDDADKHRAIRPVFIVPAAVEAFVRCITSGSATFHMPLVPIEDEATLMTVSGEAVTEVEDDIKVALAIGVEIIPQAPTSVDAALDQMFQRVVGVTQQFRDRFLS
jgi:hypothetical protein